MSASCSTATCGLPAPDPANAHKERCCIDVKSSMVTVGVAAISEIIRYYLQPNLSQEEYP